MSALPSTWGESLTSGLLLGADRDVVRRVSALGQDSFYRITDARSSLRGRFRAMCRQSDRTDAPILIHSFVTGDGKRAAHHALLCAGCDMKGWHAVSTLTQFARVFVDGSKPRLRVIALISAHASIRMAAWAHSTRSGEWGAIVIPHLFTRREGDATASADGLCFWGDEGGTPVIKTFIGADVLDAQKGLWERLMREAPAPSREAAIAMWRRDCVGAS